MLIDEEGLLALMQEDIFSIKFISNRRTFSCDILITLQ